MCETIKNTIMNNTTYAVVPLEYKNGKTWLEPFLFSTYVFCIVVSTLGLLGNSLVFFAFWRHGKTNVMMFLLQALAVTDSLLLVSIIPLCFTAHYDTPYNPAYFVHFSAENLDQFMPAQISFQRFAQTADMWTTVLVAVFRYIAVCRPLRVSSWCTLKRARIGVTLICLLSTVYSTSPLLLYVGKSALFFTLFGMNYYFFGVIMYLVCVTILIFITAMLMNELKLRANRRSEMTSVPQQSESAATRALLVVLVIFLILQTASLSILVLLLLVELLGYDFDAVGLFILQTETVLLILNSSINVFVYCMLSKQYRNLLVNAIKCRKP